MSFINRTSDVPIGLGKNCPVILSLLPRDGHKSEWNIP